jgi:hypothetical protein
MASNRIYPKSYSLIPGMSTTHHGTGEHIPNIVRMTTSYTDGGISYFNYSKITQGIHVSFANMEAYDGFCVSVSFNVVESTRYNAKKVQKVHDALAPHVDELAKLWLTDSEALKARMLELLKGV